MELKRRTFLQQTSLTLAALGLGELGLCQLADRYQQALAQPTRRKLALLVGINQYPESVCDYAATRGTALNGCLTDVELQQELLMHRFGFHPSDILTLTDQQATRRGIEDAWMGHLVQQAAPGDLLVFHFSGLGSQVQLEGRKTHQNSLVPVDGILPTAEDPIIHDLLETDLSWLLQSLPTQQVITILDVGYANLGRTLQGNLRIRARPNMPTGIVDPLSLSWQNQAATPANPANLANIPPGVVLTANTIYPTATEAQWNGFTAGLFTYALTQQLWVTTPATSLWVSFQRTANTVRQLAGIELQPDLLPEKISPEQLQRSTLAPWDAPAPLDRVGEGAIRAVDDEGRVLLWIGGLPPVVLENAGSSLFEVIEPQSAASAAGLARPLARPLLQVRSREGLVAKTRLLAASAVQVADAAPQLTVGQRVQEVVRILPRNVGLTVALDPSLKRIERVDATSAFAAIPRVSSVIAGEQPADFLFGKTKPPQVLAAALSSPPESGETVQDVPPASGTPNIKTSYGLFYPGRDVIPNTLIQTSEAVKTAIYRMTDQLKTLLAIKLLRLTQNQGSSRLGVSATLEALVPQPGLLPSVRPPVLRPVLQQETVRGQTSSTPVSAAEPPILSLGSRMQYRVQNLENDPVYVLLIGLDPKGNAMILSPLGVKVPNFQVDNEAPTQNQIAPGETYRIPQSEGESWLVSNSPGLAETHLIFSRSPFSQTVQVLESVMRSKTNLQQMTLLPEPLEVVQAVLQDIHQASQSLLPQVELPTEAYSLDVRAWATLSFVYQIHQPASSKG